MAIPAAMKARGNEVKNMNLLSRCDLYNIFNRVALSWSWKVGVLSTKASVSK